MSLNLPPRITGLMNIKHLNIKGISDLSDLPIRAIKGIGSVYEKKLSKQGIVVINNLARLTTYNLKKILPMLVERWVIAAKIIVQFASTGETSAIPSKRLVVAGLDQAGKTSVLESLRSMRSIAATRATFGARATTVLFAGFNIISFDLGGQATFREQYLSSAEAYFTDIGTLIFVIDIQTPHRQKEVNQYFQRILRLLRYLKKDIGLCILFHKYDPTGIDKETTDRLCTELENQIGSFAYSLGFESLVFFKTSIYDIPGLTYAFSQVFSQLSPVSRILNDTLGWFCEERGFDGCHLFSDNWFLVAQWTHQISESDRDDIFLKSLQAVRLADKDAISENGHVIEIAPYHFYAREITVGHTKVILSLFDVRRSKLSHSELQTLDETLSPWIQNFFALM